MKTFVIWALSGALVGIAVASLIVPPALSWYSAPGGLPKGAQIQAIVEIPEVIRYSTGRLIRGQIIGAVVGALLGVVASGVVRKKRLAGSQERLQDRTPAVARQPATSAVVPSPIEPPRRDTTWSGSGDR